MTMMPRTIQPDDMEKLLGGPTKAMSLTGLQERRHRRALLWSDVRLLKFNARSVLPDLIGWRLLPRSWTKIVMLRAHNVDVCRILADAPHQCHKPVSGVTQKGDKIIVVKPEAEAR